MLYLQICVEINYFITHLFLLIPLVLIKYKRKLKPKYKRILNYKYKRIIIFEQKNMF